MKKIYKYLILAIIIFLVIFILIKSTIIKEILYLIIISFIISYSLRPIHKVVVSKGVNKKVSAISIILILILIIIGTLVIIVPSIFKESLNVSNTISKIQVLMQNIYEKLRPLSNNKTMYVIFDTVNSSANKMLIKVFNKIFNGAINLGENLLSFAVIPIVVYYFLADSDIIANRMLMFFPTKTRSMVRRVFGDIDKILGRYILSQFMLCAIIGILTFIILIVLHVDFPIILSMLNALFNIIPYFGPIFGAIPAILIALMSSTKTAVWTAVWLYLIQQIEGNIISPKLTGDSVSMHPLLVIILLLIGDKLGGFVGMVLAVPIGVVIKVIYEDLNYYLF